MKKFFLMFALVLGVLIQASGAGWTAYPTVTTLQGPETFLTTTVNPTNNQQISASNLLSWVQSSSLSTDPQAISFISRYNLDKGEADDIFGAMEEVSSRGYRSHLVEVFPLQQRWFTNNITTSAVITNGYGVYGSRWYGNCSPWNFTNRQNLADSNYIILNLRTNLNAHTIAIVIENGGAYAHNPVGNQYASYRTMWYGLVNTNDNSFEGVQQFDPGGSFGLVVSQGGTFPVSYITNQNSYSSNQVLVARTAGSSSSCYGVNHFFHKRTTYIFSYDGNGHYMAWENGNPCAFPLNNGSSSVTFTYNCPITVSSSFNQLVIGWSQFWKTNISGSGYGYGGKIDSIMIFDCAAETNTIDSSTGFVYGSPLANCAYAASRWLEASPVEMITDGTSMMHNGTYNGPGTSGSNWSNCVAQAWYNRHPDWPAAQDYSQNGGNIQASTNCGGQLGLSKFQVPMVGIYQLPAKVTRKIIFTDHPRNDNNLGGAGAVSIFTSYYQPLKNIGCEIWYGAPAFGNTNQTRSFPSAYTNTPALNFQMATNPLISRYAPLFKYIAQGGIVDPNDSNISVVGLGTSEGAHMIGTNAQYYIEQYINMLEGGQFWPKSWPTYFANSSTVLGYDPYAYYMAPTSASPYSFTNQPYNACTSVLFLYQCTSSASISVNGVAYPASLTGGQILLLPGDWVTITTPVGLTAGYKPLPPSNSMP